MTKAIYTITVTPTVKTEKVLPLRLHFTSLDKLATASGALRAAGYNAEYDGHAVTCDQSPADAVKTAELLFS